MSKDKLRIALSLSGFLGALFFPPWVPLVMVLSLSLLFPAWEAILIGVLVDFVWLPAAPFHIPTATLVAITAVWMFEPLRREFLDA